MSALQRIERGYDLLIRLLTVIITLALLVGAGVVTVNWVRATAIAPVSQRVETPKVSASDLVTHILTPDASSVISPSDPDYASYERIRKTVAAFAKKHEVADDDVGMADILSKVKFAAADEPTVELTHAYVLGMTETLDHTLVDPKFDSLLSRLAANAQAASTDEGADSDISKPMDVVGNVVEGFNTEFDREVTSTTDGIRGQKDLEKGKVSSWAMLGQIGVPLGLLMLLLQLLTFGKIAQNLGARNLRMQRRG